MPEEVFLEGDRLALHQMEPDDHEFVARQWNVPSVREQAGWPRLPLDGDDITDVGDRGDGGPQFIACQDDTRVGFVTLYDLNWRARNAEVSYLIRPSEQGNGYATEAVDICLSYAFEELGLHKVYAMVLETTMDRSECWKSSDSNAKVSSTTRDMLMVNSVMNIGSDC